MLDKHLFCDLHTRLIVWYLGDLGHLNTGDTDFCNWNFLYFDPLCTKLILVSGQLRFENVS